MWTGMKVLVKAVIIFLERVPRHSNSSTHPRDKGRNSDDKHRRHKNYRKYEQYHENRQHKDYKDESRRPSAYPVSQAYATNTKTNKNASMLSWETCCQSHITNLPRPINRSILILRLLHIIP